MDVNLLLLAIFAALCAILVAVILARAEAKKGRLATVELNLTALALLDSITTFTELRYPTVATPLTERRDIGI